MSESFYPHLRKYFAGVAAVLRGEQDASSVFPNTTDNGQSRERSYAEFLTLHAPSKCRVFLGGLIFHFDGRSSKQLDVIVTSDICPKFDLHNRRGDGKSFAPIEGTLAAASIKANLDSAQLIDALRGIASIPPTSSLDGRKAPNFLIPAYDTWPYKIIFASRGMSVRTTLATLRQFYHDNPEIPLGRRPDLIHVAGSFVILKVTPVIKIMGTNEAPTDSDWVAVETEPDLAGMCWALEEIFSRASASAQIHTKYEDILNGLMEQVVKERSAIGASTK